MHSRYCLKTVTHACSLGLKSYNVVTVAYKGEGGRGKKSFKTKTIPKLIVIYTKQSRKWECGFCARLSNTSQGLNYLATDPPPAPPLKQNKKCKETITTYQTNCNKKRFKTLMTYFANLSSIFSLFRSLAIFSASWYSILARWGKQRQIVKYKIITSKENSLMIYFLSPLWMFRKSAQCLV